MNLSEVKVVIPARYASTRLPEKALLLIDNKPMFWHVVQRCIEAGVELSNIIVATDDNKIIEAAQKLNIPVKLTSTSHKSGTDRINEVAISLKWSEDTIVVNVQGDEPLIPNALISEVTSFKEKNPHYSITTAVVPLSNVEEFTNPNVVKTILGEEGLALYFTRSSAPVNRENVNDLSLAFRHIGIYAYTVKSLQKFCSFPESALEKYEKLEQLRALSNGLSIGACVFDGKVAHGVDTAEDFEHIKSMMEKP